MKVKFRKTAFYIVFVVVVIKLFSNIDDVKLRWLLIENASSTKTLTDKLLPNQELLDEYSFLYNWKRPGGPPRVGLQVGHLDNHALPDELSSLIGRTGTSGGGKAEWEVNLTISEKTAEILRQNNIVVDIIPATVPPKYFADAFVSIHADGSLDKSVSGYKVASPRRDYSGKSSMLAQYIDNSYREKTNLRQDPNITRNMISYYAFSWSRYEHAIHPMTTAAILETGFLTNPNDQKLLINKSEVAAQGLAEGIINYLSQEKII